MDQKPATDTWHVIKADATNGYALVVDATLLEGGAHEVEVLRNKLVMEKAVDKQFNSSVKMRHGIRYEYDGLKKFEKHLRDRGCTSSADRLSKPLMAMERQGHGGHNAGAPVSAPSRKI